MVAHHIVNNPTYQRLKWNASARHRLQVAGYQSAYPWLKDIRRMTPPFNPWVPPVDRRVPNIVNPRWPAYQTLWPYGKRLIYNHCHQRILGNCQPSNMSYLHLNSWHWRAHLAVRHWSENRGPQIIPGRACGSSKDSEWLLAIHEPSFPVAFNSRHGCCQIECEVSREATHRLLWPSLV